MPTTYEKIATYTFSSLDYTYTLTSIPATYTDLRLVIAGKSDGNNAIGLTFNADGGSNYSRTMLTGNGSTASSNRTTSTDSINIGTMSTQVSLTEVDIFSYAGSTFKTVLGSFSADKNGSGDVNRVTGLWRSTSAITSIKIISWFDTGTTISLYGILKA
jgi:hypothetical protein